MNTASIQLADEIRKSLNDATFKLPALPSSISRIQQLMAGDGYAVKDISAILSQDSAFAMVVMRLANSVRFNTTGREIRSLDMAIQRIGPKAILPLLISVAGRILAEVRQPELRNIMQAHQEHSLQTSLAAESVAHISQAANPADTFMAGLLHDQGKVTLMTSIPDRLVQASSAERLRIIQMFHREMGARLLHKWGLPEPFVLVAQHHGIESGDRPRLPMLDCIDVADTLVKRIRDDGACETLAAHPAAQRLHLNREQLMGIIVDVEDHIDELRQTFTI